MNIIAFTTTWWDDKADIAVWKKPQLESWLGRVEKYFNPVRVFLATGGKDNPALNPLADRVSIVRSFAAKPLGYDPYRYCYFLCAFEAALWEALRRPEPWDLLVDMEADFWINKTVDVPALLAEFQSRPELILSPAWMQNPDSNFVVMKRDAVPYFLHHRLRGNIVPEPLPLPMLAEVEMAAIFKDKWWNPWPQFLMTRQHWGIPPKPPQWDVVPDDIAKHWPVCRMPSPAIKELWKRE